MSRPSTNEWIGEFSHLINSPLAALRNAIYLAVSNCSDPRVLRYLHMAENEASAIAKVVLEHRHSCGPRPLRSVGRAF